MVSNEEPATVLALDDDRPTLTRSVRATALGRGTQGVPDVRRSVEGALHTAFPVRLWVAGRVGEVRDEPRVGLHFWLLASADDDEPYALTCLLADDVRPQVAEVLDRVHDADVGDLLAEGRLVRVGGLLRYDFLRDTLVLQVSDLDPAPTLRGLQEHREMARALVREHALPDRQRGRACRTAPLQVCLVGPEDDPSVDRVRALLRAAPYAVDLREVAVPVQGADAAAQVADVVREAGLRSDTVLLVRSPGRPLALAVFDAPEVAYAVAQSPVPVVCGLGGGEEQTATDDVAHVSLPDGEAAGRWLLDRLDAAHRALDELDAEVQAHARTAGARTRAALAEAEADVREFAERAAARSLVARRRLQLRALAVTAVLAVAVVVAAVVLGLPLLLLALVGLGALWLAAWGWSRWSYSRGSRPMSQQDDDFTAVLARLRSVRDELAATSSPEAVHRLRLSAAELVARGREILGRTVEPAPTPVMSGAAGG